MKTVNRHLYSDLHLCITLDEEGSPLSSQIFKSKDRNIPPYTEGEFKVNFKKLKFTPFHEKVYSKLAKVKKGSTVTYKKMAEISGHPKAYRAVGSAMAKNPLVYIIPCHRVLKSDGGLGNYSGLGGNSTKTQLLNFESRP